MAIWAVLTVVVVTLTSPQANVGQLPVEPLVVVGPDGNKYLAYDGRLYSNDPKPTVTVRAQPDTPTPTITGPGANRVPAAKTGWEDHQSLPFPYVALFLAIALSLLFLVGFLTIRTALGDPPPRRRTQLG